MGCAWARRVKSKRRRVSHCPPPSSHHHHSRCRPQDRPCQRRSSPSEDTHHHQPALQYQNRELATAFFDWRRFRSSRPFRLVGCVESAGARATQQGTLQKQTALRQALSVLVGFSGGIIAGGPSKDAGAVRRAMARVSLSIAPCRPWQCCSDPSKKVKKITLAKIWQVAISCSLEGRLFATSRAAERPPSGGPVRRSSLPVAGPAALRRRPSGRAAGLPTMCGGGRDPT